MDYKDLIKELKEFTYWLGQSGLESHDIHPIVCDKAVAAIETLLAERDAAVEDLRGMCWCCAHGRKYENGLPWSKATTCEHMRDLGVVARSGGKCKCQFWEWRGTQKESESDGQA